MESKVLVLSSKLSLNSSLPQQIMSEFSSMYFDINEDKITIPNIDWFDKNSFEEDLDNLRVFARQIKNKVKGELLVYVKEGDNVYQGRYKLMTNQTLFEQCELNVLVKKQKGEKKETLTESQKLELFKEYWEKKQTVPGKNEVYNGFRVGSFFHTMMKNQNTIELINQIMGNNDGK